MIRFVCLLSLVVFAISRDKPIHEARMDAQAAGRVWPPIAAAERPSMFVGDPEGEIARIIRKENCGYVVATGGVTVLADRIIEASKNDAENAKKGRNARNAFERRFNRNVAMASWGALLK